MKSKYLILIKNTSVIFLFLSAIILVHHSFFTKQKIKNVFLEIDRESNILIDHQEKNIFTLYVIPRGTKYASLNYRKQFLIEGIVLQKQFFSNGIQLKVEQSLYCLRKKTAKQIIRAFFFSVLFGLIYTKFSKPPIGRL